MKTLKIEMIHDAVCSWCPIGYRYLKQALKNMKIDADIHFLPFELNPNMPENGEEVGLHLQKAYGWTEQKHADYRRHLLNVASKANVVIDFTKRTHYYNTNLAHRLIHIAEQFGRQEEANEILIDAYFKRGLDIGQEEILLDLAQQIGLGRDHTKSELRSERVLTELNHKKRRVESFNVSSTPTFIFNESLLIPGSNSVDHFEDLLVNMSSKVIADASL